MQINSESFVAEDIHYMYIAELAVIMQQRILVKEVLERTLRRGFRFLTFHVPDDVLQRIGRSDSAGPKCVVVERFSNELLVEVGGHGVERVGVAPGRLLAADTTRNGRRFLTETSLVELRW